MFRTVGSYMPAPPPGLKPPVTWGEEQHVSALFAGTGAELSFERRSVTFTHDSPESWVEYSERVLGADDHGQSRAGAAGPLRRAAR